MLGPIVRLGGGIFVRNHCSKIRALDRRFDCDADFARTRGRGATRNHEWSSGKVFQSFHMSLTLH